SRVVLCPRGEERDMRLTATLLFVLLALTPLARADEWSKTYAITGKPELRVETSDANIRVDTWRQNPIEARVTSEHWKIGEGGGSIKLELPENFAADVDLHTGDGHISLDMPVTVEGRLGGNNIHGKLNGGGNLLTIHTGDGSIKLQKS